MAVCRSLRWLYTAFWVLDTGRAKARGMQLDYTVHARRRMAERAITIAEVESTIAGFDVQYPDRDGNSCYVREINGRWIRVVIVKGSQPPRVKTVITF